MSRSAFDVVAGHNLQGRTIIVTGANTGIGEPTARVLASAGARVIYACRNREAGEAAVARARREFPSCRAEFAALDLASLASVRRFAEALDAERVDALVCNAGLSRLDFAATEDGFEQTVGVCHIGHFLLTRLLMPRLLAAPAPRVVMVSSASHAMPPKLDFSNFPMQRETYRGLTAYGQAKLANVLMAKSLHRRYGNGGLNARGLNDGELNHRGLVACALHPGTLVTTDIGRNSAVIGLLMRLVSPFTKTPVEGAASSVWAVVHEPAAELAGQYLKECRVDRSSPESNDPAVAERVWALSEAWVEQAGEVPAWP
jgi:NAD(P)-dependent dehydrogenase (short-subunit alcohol dehydrogenase family)